MTMAKETVTVNLQTLARLGAEQELLDLQQRQRILEQAFPGIKAQLRRAIVRANLNRARTALAAKRRLTRAQRKAISERMTKYWAARRKAAS
jgi:hypothetical protein